jgi:acetyltransferase-like isoleucine patch superfamily enzyme
MKIELMIHFKRYLLALFFFIYNGILSHFPGYAIRLFYLRKILRYSFGKGSSVHMGCFFTGSKLNVGNNTILNRNGYYDCRLALTIGSNVSISPKVYIITAGHDPQSPTFSDKSAPVVIEDFVWIGARAIILPGVTMGKGSVAGAGSVVTKNVAPFTIVAGNPAKVIGKRTENLIYTLHWKPYFNTDIHN